MGIHKPDGAKGKSQHPRTSEMKTTKSVAKPDDVATLILSTLANAEDPLAKAEIIERTGIKTSEWNKTIKALIKSGDVIKTGEKRGTRYERE
jgi:predicted transcriptional regulator